MSERNVSESYQGSSHNRLLEILDGNKILVINCTDYQVSVINGSIGNDSKNGAFVNVEIDFGGELERYQVRRFGVNRIIANGEITRLGIRVLRDWHLSRDEPVPYMDYHGLSEIIWSFVEKSMENGRITRFREAIDFRKTLEDKGPLIIYG